MLGSDHDGERATAARLATLELRRLGLTWAELIGKAFQAPKEAPREEPADWRRAYQRPPGRSYTAGRRSHTQGGLDLWDFVRYADSRRDQLGTWDKAFIDTFINIGAKCTATDGQWRQVFRIAEQLGIEVAA